MPRRILQRLLNHKSGWKAFSVIFREDYGWLVEPTGKPATMSILRFVLANVSDIQIRGDHYIYSKDGYGQETTYINDIKLYESL